MKVPMRLIGLIDLVGRALSSFVVQFLASARPVFGTLCRFCLRCCDHYPGWQLLPPTAL